MREAAGGSSGGLPAKAGRLELGHKVAKFSRRLRRQHSSTHHFVKRSHLLDVKTLIR